MALTTGTRLCASCRQILPEPPAAPACEHCGRVHCPHWSTWPPLLIWWLLRELATTRFLPWVSEQEAFERLLEDALNGVRMGSARPNPHRTLEGAPINSDTPAAELFATAIARAQAWKASGSPIPPSNRTATARTA
jgi:hypothetical protein